MFPTALFGSKCYRVVGKKNPTTKNKKQTNKQKEKKTPCIMISSHLIQISPEWRRYR